MTFRSGHMNRPAGCPRRLHLAEAHYSESSSSRAIRKLTSNPVINPCFQHVERQASSTENFIMEGPDIEAGTKLLLCAIAEVENLELTTLVAQALSRPCNIPVNFSLDRRLICGAAFA